MTKQLDYKSSIEERQDLFDKVYDCLLSVVSSEHISDSNFIPEMFGGRSQNQAEAIYYVICKGRLGDSGATKIILDAVSADFKGKYTSVSHILNARNVSDVKDSSYITSIFLDRSQSHSEAIYYVICKARYGYSEASKILRDAISVFVDS